MEIKTRKERLSDLLHLERNILRIYKRIITSSQEKNIPNRNIALRDLDLAVELEEKYIDEVIQNQEVVENVQEIMEMPGFVNEDCQNSLLGEKKVNFPAIRLTNALVNRGLDQLYDYTSDDIIVMGCDIPESFLDFIYDCIQDEQEEKKKAHTEEARMNAVINLYYLYLFHKHKKMDAKAYDYYYWIIYLNKELEKPLMHRDLYPIPKEKIELFLTIEEGITLPSAKTKRKWQNTYYKNWLLDFQKLKKGYPLERISYYNALLSLLLVDGETLEHILLEMDQLKGFPETYEKLKQGVNTVLSYEEKTLRKENDNL